MNPQTVPTVSVSDVTEQLPEGQILLDVREDDEWAAGHSPSALHLPMGELTERLGELPQDADVFVICRSGGRSARVTAYLNANGWDAVNIAGGMTAWARDGRTLVSETGADPTVI